MSIAAITTALTNLACRCYADGRDLPRVGAIVLDEHTLTLILTEDTPEPVEPFTANGPKRWAATTADIAAETTIDDLDAVDPYPLLVTLGHTSEGTVLVNLEAAGTLTITGDEGLADEVLHALIVEAATPELSGRLAVVVDDMAELADAFEPHRLRTGDVRSESHATAAAVQRFLSDQGIDDTLQARADRQAPDTWLPTTFAARDLGSTAVAWSGVAVVTTGSPDGQAWRIIVSDDGQARLDPLGLDFQPQRLAHGDLSALRGLLQASVPPAPTSGGAKQQVSSALETTTALRAVIPEPEATPISPSSEAIIRVLGPIEFDGFPAASSQLSSRMQELLVYLALHGPTTGADLDDVLWNGARISPGTRNALVYRTRLKVGDSVLPRLDGGRYALGPSITTDWSLFQQHVARAVHVDDDVARLDELAAALALVNDRPFRGITGGAFTWADLDIQVMCSAVADAALLLGQLLRAHGRNQEALGASARGLRAEPYSESLQELAITAVQATAGDDAATRVRLSFVEAGAALDAEAV